VNGARDRSRAVNERVARSGDVRAPLDGARPRRPVERQERRPRLRSRVGRRHTAAREEADGVRIAVATFDDRDVDATGAMAMAVSCDFARSAARKSHHLSYATRGAKPPRSPLLGVLTRVEDPGSRPDDCAAWSCNDDVKMHVSALPL
jgi:hypothetical protein